MSSPPETIYSGELVGTSPHHKENRNVHFSNDDVPSTSKDDKRPVIASSTSGEPVTRVLGRNSRRAQSLTATSTATMISQSSKRQNSYPLSTESELLSPSRRAKVTVNVTIQPLESSPSEDVTPRDQTVLRAVRSPQESSSTHDLQSSHTLVQSSSPGSHVKHPSSPSNIFTSSPVKDTSRSPPPLAFMPPPSSPLPPSSLPGSPATGVLSSSPIKQGFLGDPFDDVFAASSFDDQPERAQESSPTRPSIAMSEPSNLLKRPLDEDDLPSQTEERSKFSLKRPRLDETRSSPPPHYPATRRLTPASQKRAFKKLAAPFRSPMIKRDEPPTPQAQGSEDPNFSQIASKNASGALRTPARPRASTSSARSSASPTASRANLSSRLTAQFKSPLQSRGEPSSSRATGVLPTAEIQALEAQLHTLKRAIKIKRKDEEDKLSALALKWRDAAREAAYDLWSIVRDSTNVQEAASSSASGWAPGWGWDDKHNDSGEGGDVQMRERPPPVEERRQETLGVMLRKLNIDPQTLGWNDSEECFVD